MTVRIVVTDLEYRKAKAIFDAAADRGLACVPAPESEAELAAAIARHGARHAIVGVAKYAGPLYRALPKGGVLARFGVGHDGIDKAAATKAGILCTNTPGALDDSVAELTIALLLCAARRIPDVAAGMRAAAWEPHVGSELKGKTLAIIGCGAIGCRVARIAAFGFGMHVVGCETRPVDAAEMRSRFGFERTTADFADAVRDADFVSVHVPGTPATRHFINAERLAAIPAGAWLLNTARGAVLDELALYDALRAGSPAGAALDVFENEPYRPVLPSHDLRSLPNVLMTPHIGSSTREACSRMAERALRNIESAERRDFDHMDLLNPEVLGEGRGD